VAISTGKAARRRQGNRYDCKKSNRRRNPVKIARWNEQERERNRKNRNQGA
jgi:hypothetical protein